MSLQTPLHQVHVDLVAKMVDFAGFQMPVTYSGIRTEHTAVRRQAGLFDVSHMGEFRVEGAGSGAFLEWMTSNHVAKLFPGRVQYSCMPNGKGGIVDDLLVYQLGDEAYLLVVNAGNTAKDWAWLGQHAASFNEGKMAGLPSEAQGGAVTLTDLSRETALLALQGPKAADILQPLCDKDLSDLSYYHFTHAAVAGLESVLVSATGYTGAGGFELYVSSDQATKLWASLMEAGAPHGMLPCGLGCRDTLRLEMGYCLYGNDIDETTSPLEAGLGWITALDKDFIDKELVLQQKTKGVSRKLMGFVMEEKGIPRKGYPIEGGEGNLLGTVTSGSESISTGKFIGMGYVAASEARIGQTVGIRIRDRLLKATLVRPPFV